MSNDTGIDLRPPPPVLYGLRLWWHEWVTRNNHRAATLRWQMINATDPQECPCGARGTVATEALGFRGDAAPIEWSCDEHIDIPLTTCWVGGVPQINQSRDECTWCGYGNRDRIITECGCGTHIGELA